MTPETFEHIRDDINTRIVESRYDDPQLLPDLLSFAMASLSLMATRQITHIGDSAGWASSVLLGMQSRAVSGIPYGEPEEPAWSLDAERPRPFERVLSDGDGDLG